MLEHRQKITSYSGLCRHNRKRDLFKSSVSALTIGGTMRAFTGCVDGKAQSSPKILFSIQRQAVTASIKGSVGEECKNTKIYWFGVKLQIAQ